MLINVMLIKTYIADKNLLLNVMLNNTFDNFRKILSLDEASCQIFFYIRNTVTQSF